MTEKIKIAVNWAASCGGCDVSLLDIEAHILELAALADIVYWPVAMDFKAAEFLALDDNSVDFGLYNGAVRTDEHAEMARAFRDKCKVLVAYGSCACFGGIPGLANLATRDDLFAVSYKTTPSTENPQGTIPQTECRANGVDLTLPTILDHVLTLPQVVDVDAMLPGCPPPTERILDLVGVVKDYVESGAVPPKGTVIASHKALCDECPRNHTRQPGRIAEVLRPHEVLADPDRCFLDQGIICLGIATRGGCGASCIQANMPCRGCFGPTADMLDPGAEAISAIGSLTGAANEDDVQPHEMKRGIRSIKDPAGTFYRFTLPNAFINRAVSDVPEKE